MNKKVLIIEDESQIASILQDYFQQSGFEVHTLDSGAKAVDTIKKLVPDAVVLDLMLPDTDGLEVCRQVRKFSNVPMLMATAKVEEIDRLIGLELGADDYICKPYSPREVVARVKAVLRRLTPETTEEVLTAGPVVIQPSKYQVTVNGNDLTLTRSEFELLYIMAKQPGRVFSRTDLIANVHGYEFEGYERTIDSHVKNLRKKISAVLNDKDVIQTVYGVGYKFETI
ncbi:response regulator [Seleniivibrio sp.]|uniref:response regulator n=1 Tax=Seleniivibrio sp. TaxID=2898801 RepID=UPI0025F3697B|nr:response regulator [Seleniivibrio sp.]MCD8552420.1 response regulator [Seleniivibrio sp.]